MSQQEVNKTPTLYKWRSYDTPLDFSALYKARLLRELETFCFFSSVKDKLVGGSLGKTIL